MVKYVLGHKNPDTDSTCSSVIYSQYLTAKGVENKVIKLGDINNETKFVLEKFNVQVPETVTELEEGSELVLLDHNEAKQSIDNRDKYKIYQIIDHHKFDFAVKEPLYIRSEPIGSSCSIVAKILFEDNFEISKAQASLLISAILSDTLYFRSPTTTEEDKQIVNKLNEIAQIGDLEAYSLEMFAAKSDLGDIEVEKLIKLDYKEFDFNGKKYGIGVMETTSPQYGLNRKEEIIEKLKEIKQKDNLDGVFLSIVDILNEKNTTLYPDKEIEETLKDVFNAEIVEEGVANLNDAISRKKQIVPKLEEYF